MPNSKNKANSPTQAQNLPLEVDLRNRNLATFLAWFLPGLGHLYQRRTGKGLLYMITILSTFSYGMYLGDGRVVYASTTKPPIPLGLSRRALGEMMEGYGRWHYLCQVPVGLPAIPAYIQTWRVESGASPLPFFGDNFQRPPYTREQESNGQIVTQGAVDYEKEYFSSTDDTGNLVTHDGEREKWHHDLAYFFELGTVFTMIAGLLNVLAICDARWGPLVVLPPPDEKQKDSN